MCDCVDCWCRTIKPRPIPSFIEGTVYTVVETEPPEGIEPSPGVTYYRYQYIEKVEQ